MTLQQLEEILEIEEERLEQRQEVLDELKYFIERLKNEDFSDSEEKETILSDIKAILDENKIEY